MVGGLSTINKGEIMEEKYENEFAVATVSAGSSLANIEQSRAVAEVQAAIVLARANPRNEHAAVNAIMSACKRKSLAEKATYAYKRGGQIVTGPSIRLAEVLAQVWGNIQYGFREIGRGDDYSEVESFAYDLQNNVKVTRQFQVRHWRDKKGGGAAITEERDKYELIASMAQRRVRACLLELIPGDVVEAAEEACKATLTKSIGNIEEQGKKIVDSFTDLGVSQQDIEGYLQRKITGIVPVDVVNLKRIYMSIRDGIAAKEEFFKGSKTGGAAAMIPTADQPPVDAIPTAKQAEVLPARNQKKVFEYKDKIDKMSSSEALDKWRAASRHEISTSLPAEDDQMEVFEYADEVYRMLKMAGE